MRRLYKYFTLWRLPRELSSAYIQFLLGEEKVMRFY
jgi:hypothetical protein